MSLRLGGAGWLLPAVVVATGLAWWYWGAGGPEAPPQPVSAPLNEAGQLPGHVPTFGVSPPGDDQTTRAAVAESGSARARIWETVKAVCPWPPLPSSWQVLDEPCLSAMNRLDDDPDGFAPPGWRDVLLNDPLRTRREVAAALARHDCSVVALAHDWPGETRPELRAGCAADAMLRLAELQDKCVERLHKDWEQVHARAEAMVEEISDSQEEYHRLIESDYRASTFIYWETYMCRTVPPETFEWIEALPVPPGDPTAHRYNRPPITQALDLYDAARRLGAEIPDWALGQLELIAEIEKRREQDVPEDGLRGV